MYLVAVWLWCAPNSEECLGGLHTPVRVPPLWGLMPHGRVLLPLDNEQHKQQDDGEDNHDQHRTQHHDQDVGAGGQGHQGVVYGGGGRDHRGAQQDLQGLGGVQGRVAFV